MKISDVSIEVIEREIPDTGLDSDLGRFSGPVALGLAWTSVGGDILFIEATNLPGADGLKLTGSLGDVMKESAEIAYSYLCANLASYKADRAFFDEAFVHLHVPEGATPKDGPSAGITIASALLSLARQQPPRSGLAMTGEITLRGEVLAIGGLKEKLLAAHRGGIKTVVIPKENEKDLKDIPDNIKADLQVLPVDWIDEVLDVALESKPEDVIGEIMTTDDANTKKDDSGRPSTH